MRRRIVIAALACATVAGIASVAWAAVGDGGTIKTCFKASTATWRPIDSSASCKSGENQLDFYSKTGADATFLGKTAKAADSDKLDGIDSAGFVQTSQLSGTVKNVYRVFNDNVAAGPGQTIVNAVCNTGDVVLGGGYRLDPTTQNYDAFLLSELPINVVVSNDPLVLAAAWSVNVINRETIAGHDVYVSAVAVCGQVAS
jgi:hypothetical protein